MADFTLEGVATNAKNVGKSVVQYVTGRGLTAGEIEMAKKIFHKGIDFSKVKVHGHGAYIRNSAGTAMTPNGEMYFNPEEYKSDFSQASIVNQALFIHEMTHCWQHQKNFPVRAVGIKFHGFQSTNPYKYFLATGGLSIVFQEYNFESQAALIQDYYAFFIKNSEQDGSWQNADYMTEPSPFKKEKMNNLKKLVEGFINSNQDKNWLPSRPYSLGMVRSK